MRKQIAASGWLPGYVQVSCGDGYKNKIFLMTKMPTRRFLRLGGGRKMNISVFQINGGTFENAGRHRIIP